MEGTRVRLDGVGASWFFPEGDVVGLALNLPGLPGRVHATPLVPTLLDLGYAVLQLQYLGTYDSDGEFDPRTSHEVVLRAAASLASGNLLDPWDGAPLLPAGLDPRPVLLAAHSFGTYAAFRSVLAGINVGKVALFAPMLRLGRYSQQDGLKLDLKRHVSRIATIYPLTHRLLSEQDLLDFFTADEVTYPSRASAGSKPTEFGLFVGSADASLDAEKALEASTDRVREFFGEESVACAAIISGGSHGVDTMIAADTEQSIVKFLKPN